MTNPLTPQNQPNKNRALLNIQQLEDARRDFERKAQDANTQYILATVGALIGLLILVFVGHWLGIVILLAGALAVFTQGSRKRRAQREIDKITGQIRETRENLIGLVE